MQGDPAEKKGKVKKGWLAVRVGQAQAEQQGDGFRRFVIPIAYLYHPLFQRLLEAARDTYGYSSAGPLWLPCSVDEFLRLRARSSTGRRRTRTPRPRTACTCRPAATSSTATPSPRAPAPRLPPDRPTDHRAPAALRACVRVHGDCEHRSARAPSG
ncbi:hypothetical protein CFC21_089459 [Triticum aestivum]|uniref:Uncharacterized protein n=2 Tax=Triticum aestivum TaxID=4565 RepID=A0A3B6PQK8_WHEAT|nr:hypothetical protein CFC21_089459 [Triticum aestivum]